jgi:hypothetical protein
VGAVLTGRTMGNMEVDDNGEREHSLAGPTSICPIMLFCCPIIPICC